MALLLLDRGDRRLEALAPCLVEPLPVLLARSRGLSGGLSVELDVLQRGVQLVPLDLVRNQRRDEVVDVRHRSDQDGKRVAVVVPAPPAGGSLDRLPLHDVRPEHRPETLRALSHDHVPRAIDRAGQPAHRIKERAHVALRLPGQRMKDRAHADMRLHQGVDLDLARALEHRRVGADVELDGMLAAAPASGRRRLHQVSLKPGSPPHPRAY